MQPQAAQEQHPAQAVTVVIIVFKSSLLLLFLSSLFGVASTVKRPRSRAPGFAGSRHLDYRVHASSQRRIHPAQGIQVAGKFRFTVGTWIVAVKVERIKFLEH
jgi:hypothetical protein